MQSRMSAADIQDVIGVPGPGWYGEAIVAVTYTMKGMSQACRHDE
jgi:hypothetical protein